MAVGRLMEAKLTCDMELEVTEKERKYAGRFWWMGAKEPDFWRAKVVVHKDSPPGEPEWAVLEMSMYSDADTAKADDGGCYWWWNADDGPQMDEFVNDMEVGERAWAMAGMEMARAVLQAFLEELIIKLELNVPEEEASDEDG